jgi:hypothetical protein
MVNDVPKINDDFDLYLGIVKRKNIIKTLLLIIVLLLVNFYFYMCVCVGSECAQQAQVPQLPYN